MGDWTWTTSCTDETNTGLNGISGEVTCVEYTGELDIYKHGFVKTEDGVRYFMYDDGTPFFYLGDTHWTLPMENIDGINPNYEDASNYSRVLISQETADEYGITSMFKYIMDYRAEQGFTVIQSQQLAIYNGVSGNSWMGDSEGTMFTHGVNDMILEKFQELDRYFEYIAELGFVHSHTQFAYPEELIEIYLTGGITEEKIDKLCRYWVARYSAYPVMWATAQEGDNDYYEYNGCTPETNPWKIVLESIAKYDPYDHPSTCHQENWNETVVEDSAFGTLEAHSWYATQWNFGVENGDSLKWRRLKEYYDNPGSKPVVNYEGHYDHYWGGTFKARAQGWVAFMNGQFGYGYGIQPIWSLFWGGGDSKTSDNDGYEEFSLELNWLEGLYSEASTQLSYMKNFLEKYEWWNLAPCFNKFFIDDEADAYYEHTGRNYSVSHIGNELYIGYFYGSGENNTNLGILLQMENADYEVVWMNCVTGEFTEPEVVTITDGTLTVPVKPTDEDWVIAVKLIEN